MRPLIIFSAVLVSAAAGADVVSAQIPAQADSVTQAFRGVLTLGDAEKVGAFFAETIVFEGDARFVGATKKEGRHTVRRQDLQAAFAQLFAELGSEWSSLMKQTLSSLEVATKDAEHHKLAKRGDLVYSLSAPGRTGPDDALVFVFRSTEDGLRVVAHYGDY
jgi:hypothetical protein